ncbi:MAG TPA: transglycosylase domain-containing protein [Solimonas sp.]
MIRRRAARWALALCAGAALALVAATALGQRALPARLDLATETAGRIAVLDRDGRLLRAHYDGGWNLHERLSLEAMPALLREAFIAAEDRRFWTHSGLDWRARLAAVAQNLRAGRALRGASTISEQVVRLLNPRPRTLWSRWLEGWEALRLEARFSKAEILEFYLNQVPYGANRRGVLPAARLYFDRHVDSLSQAEMLALAVLVRAPSRLSREPQALLAGVRRLAQALQQDGTLDAATVAAVLSAPVVPSRHVPPMQAAHFHREVERRWQMLGASPQDRVRSSLDARLQAQAEAYLRERLNDLAREGARQGAVLIVELPEHRVRAWAVGDREHADVIGIDSVRSPRQPGSTLKPLLYAQAIERGWSAETPIEDAPLAERVNRGLHQYRNYSRQHYGTVSLREALGNSLNIPAIKALQFVGAGAFLQKLHTLGIDSLRQHPNAYGDGLALGNGEVSLYELVQAYAALAHDGRWQPLTVFEDAREPRPLVHGFDVAAARAVSAILADPGARQLEFGDGGVLRFPAATAVKTGTSNDYRDAWTLAYDARYVVGVWIGNLSGRETEGVTGARGPALLTRSLLAALADSRRPLAVAAATDPADDGEHPVIATGAEAANAESPRLLQPFEGLQMAMDPRIPESLQAFEFRLDWREPVSTVEWWVDGQVVARGEALHWSWPLRRGAHRVRAQVMGLDGATRATQEVEFRVR